MAAALSSPVAVLRPLSAGFRRWVLPPCTVSGRAPLRCRPRPWLRLAAPSSPPPPAPEPPSPKDLTSGAQAIFSRALDRVRIFFAVFFWMSLFFWGSAWDGRDGKKKKGPWFRK